MSKRDSEFIESTNSAKLSAKKELCWRKTFGQEFIIKSNAKKIMKYVSAVQISFFM